MKLVRVRWYAQYAAANGEVNMPASLIPEERPCTNSDSLYSSCIMISLAVEDSEGQGVPNQGAHESAFGLGSSKATATSHHRMLQ